MNSAVAAPCEDLCCSGTVSRAIRPSPPGILVFPEAFGPTSTVKGASVISKGTPLITRSATRGRASYTVVARYSESPRINNPSIPAI